MFGLPAAATKVGNQSSPEKIPFSTLPAGTLPGQRMMAGERKPPSSAVPLPPANGVWPPSGQVKFSVPLSVREHDDRVVVEPVGLEVGHDRADDVVELGHAGFLLRPAVLRVAHRLILGRQVRHHMHARRVEPEEEGLVVLLRLVEEGDRLGEDGVVDGLHQLGTHRPVVLDLLLADLAPAGLHRRVVGGRGPAVYEVPRSHHVPQVLRIVRVTGVLHRVQMVEIPVEFVEAVHRGQELVQVAEVVLAELAGGVAHRLERGGNGHGLRRDPDGRTGLADGGHAGTDRQLTGDEVCSTGRAARLGVVVGEAHSLGRPACPGWACFPP